MRLERMCCCRRHLLIKAIEKIQTQIELQTDNLPSLTTLLRRVVVILMLTLIVLGWVWVMYTFWALLFHTLAGNDFWVALWQVNFGCVIWFVLTDPFRSFGRQCFSRGAFVLAGTLAQEGATLLGVEAWSLWGGGACHFVFCGGLSEGFDTVEMGPWCDGLLSGLYWLCRHLRKFSSLGDVI